MSLCPGCSRRPQLHDVGLCGECHEQKLLGDARDAHGELSDVHERFEKLTESVEDIILLTPEQLVETLKHGVVDALDSLLDPARKPALIAFGAGLAAVVVSARGATIERLP